MVRAPNETKLDPVPLRLFLLGAFRLERDSRTLQLPTRKVESLLAYLVLHPEEHPREKLAALFWGDATDEQARTSLRTALTALRKELGEDILIADRETVQLNPDKPIWVDARAFEQLATEDSQSAIPLYHSNLLPDFYDDWIAPERERLRSLYLDTLLQLVQQARSESQYARAIELACKALASDPANEKAYQHIIFCYAAIGDRIGALKQYDECEKKLRDELGVAPSKETTALRDQIEQALTGTKSREAAFTNVPAPLTSFIGRAHAIVEIKRLVEATRLLTLTGAGGCGKTRLAVQVATELANANCFKHGVWWVELAALSDATLVPQAVAAVFNLQESEGIPLATVLVSYLSGKELLLVLDNCEHLIDACARLAASLLGACSKLRVLATSREPLGILGEVAWRVPSLALPGAEVMRLLQVDDLAACDAIRLFTARAEQIAPQWKLRDHAPATADICTRLDGIPLAIELAAARLKVLSAEEIAARLEDRFSLLTVGGRTAMPRHQTLEATMDWSYDLLSDAERALLRRLSVFAGGFTLEAVEYVCAEIREGSAAGENAPPLPRSPAPLLDLLSALIDKSLVVVEQKGNATRYRLLETVRQYAREKLLEANESEARRVSRRHRDWFLQFAEQAAPKLRGRGQLEWCERLDLELENLRAALTWSLAQTDHGSAELTMRLTGSLWWFWLLRGYWVEARTWLERSLENPAVTPARAMPLIGLAQMEFHAGTPAKGRALYEEALALYRQQGDKWGIAFAASFCGGKQSDPSKADALFEEARSIARELKDEWLAARPDISQGMYYSGRGDLARARSLFESALEHARRCGERWFIGNALSNLGEIARDQGDYDRATVLLTENLEVRRELGNQNSIAGQFYGLGTVAWRRQDRQQAEALFKQALALARETGYSRVVSVGLWAFGRMAATEKRYERAARLFGVVESLCERMHTKDRRAYEDDVRALRAQLGEPVFDKARAEGRAMSLEQAIAYALEDVKNE